MPSACASGDPVLILRILAWRPAPALKSCSIPRIPRVHQAALFELNGCAMQSTTRLRGSRRGREPATPTYRTHARPAAARFVPRRGTAGRAGSRSHPARLCSRRAHWCTHELSACGSINALSRGYPPPHRPVYHQPANAPTSASRTLGPWDLSYYRSPSLVKRS
jgi:hypothetical protein